MCGSITETSVKAGFWDLIMWFVALLGWDISEFIRLLKNAKETPIAADK